MPENRLYLVLYPNYSLIASQLEPERFAKHYAQGSTSISGGNFLFVDVDPGFRHEYFNIEAALADVKPHSDGRPKSTKFICNYRTLEHMDFDALRNMYYCNAYGDYVELKPGEFDPAIRGDEMRIFLDINPTKMVALTKYNFIEYGQFITNPGSFVGAPVMLYTQMNFYIDDFLTQFAENPFLTISIPGVHPARLRDAIMEVRKKRDKVNKGLSLNCPFDKVSYRSLRRGFMFASKTKSRFYPLVPLEDVERDFYKFWKSM
ncbi:MAG: hypothetical protein FWG66_06495 [Spirochaetes bacterium]|nr:hypothetical protein [Spirochaetota bacterium]